MASNLQVFNKTITNPKTQEYLTQVLGEKKSSFINNLTALVANNKALQVCEPITLMYAAIKATALSLPLDSNLGFAYVIPYNNRKAGVSEAQFQIGYKGFIQLAIRSGQFKTLNVTEVKEGEIQDEDLISGTINFRRVEDRETKPTVGYVAFFKLVNGFEKMLYMSVDEVTAHANRYSQTFSSKTSYVKDGSKWTTDFDAMAKKTVMKLLLSRYAPLSVEMQSAVNADQAVFKSEDTPEYVDNQEQIESPKEETDAIAEEALAKATKAKEMLEQAMEAPAPTEEDLPLATDFELEA